MATSMRLPAGVHPPSTAFTTSPLSRASMHTPNKTQVTITRGSPSQPNHARSTTPSHSTVRSSVVPVTMSSPPSVRPEPSFTGSLAAIIESARPPPPQPTEFAITDPRVAAALRAWSCHGASRDGDDHFGVTVHPNVYIKEKNERQELYPLLVQDLHDKVT